MRIGRFILCALLFFTMPALARAEVTDPMLLLQTDAGTMFFELDTEFTPKTAEHIRKLVEAGVYDSVPFTRIERDFVVQTSDASERLYPLAANQRELLKPIALETSPGASRHVRGSLSLAHEDGKPDSGVSSFSILLAESRHLDGEYTVFGKLVRGEQVLQALSEITTDEKSRPKTPVRIIKAYIVPRGSVENNPDVSTPVNSTWLKTNQDRIAKETALLTENRKSDAWLLGSLALLFLISLGSLFHSSLRRFALLVSFLSGAGFFMTGLKYVPLMNDWQISLSFLALVFYFRLMSRFENSN